MSVTAKNVLAACAVGVVGVGSVSAQTVDWTGSAGNGLWITGGNWAGGLVPSGPAAIARFADPLDAAAVTATVPAINGLEILDPAAIVFIDASGTLTLTGAASTNNGAVVLNRNNSSANGVLSLSGTTTFSGTGEIQMRTSGDNSQIAGLGTMVNSSTHTVRGVGYINAGIMNMGRIAADVGVALSGNDLEIRTGGQNAGTLASTTGSLLQIVSSPITQTGGGQIAAEGGQVEYTSGSSVTGGSLESNMGGLHFTSGGVSMTDVTNNADLFVNAGSTASIFGSGLLNDGLVVLNNQNSAANAIVTFENTGSLAGSGELQLRNGSNDDSQINTGVGATINHAAAHTIRGGGLINAGVNNAGVIAADSSVTLSGSTLSLQTNDKTNSGLLESRAGSVLQIVGIAIDQSGGGAIAANEGVVSFFLADAEVLGGDVTSSGAGSVGVRGGSTTTFDGVNMVADFFVDAGGTLNIDAGGINNNGTIRVNNQNSSADGIITTDNVVTIDGSGTIVFRTGSSNSFMTTTGAGQITLGAGQLVTGAGELDGSFVNNGVISADLAATFGVGPMQLDVGPFINNNLLTAEPGSNLDILDVLVTQDAGAAIESNDGLVTIGVNSRIENGSLRSIGSGLFRTASGGNRELSAVTLDGTLQIDQGTTVTVDAAGLVNNGLIEINRNNSSADGNLDLANATISGIGEIQLRTGGSDSLIRTNAATTGVIGSGQLVRGAGWITGAITNDGVIAADASVTLSGNQIELRGENKINNNQLRAEAGSLLSIVGVSVDQSSGGSTLADSGRVEFRSASLIGGTLGTANGGTWATDTGVTSFEGVAVSGAGAVDAGTTLNVIGDTLSNDADIIVNPQNSSADGTIQINEDAAFSGSGSMDFRTAGFGNSRVVAAVGLDPLPTLTNAAGHTMAGVATIEVPMINEGTIVVGRPTGDFFVSQPLTLAPSSQFNVAVAGNAQNGQLDPTGAGGSVDLAGTLNVSVVDGSVLTNNWNHIIVDGPYTGAFDTTNLAVQGQLITRLRYETDQVVLRTRCRADTNLDGSVTPADFNTWIVAFNTQDSVADQNLDGLITPADFNAWIINFNTPCP